MAHIDYTRPDYTTPAKPSVCLTKEECELLLPVVKKAVKAAQKKYDKYKDIHEGGEATETQTDKLCQSEEVLETLKAVEHHMNFLLTHCYRKKS